MIDEDKRETLTRLGAGAANLIVAGMAEAHSTTATRPDALRASA
jgi:hypothetical protein